jgi:hypothetical protein
MPAKKVPNPIPKDIQLGESKEQQFEYIKEQEYDDDNPFSFLISKSQSVETSREKNILKRETKKDEKAKGTDRKSKDAGDKATSATGKHTMAIFVNDKKSQIVPKIKPVILSSSSHKDDKVKVVTSTLKKREVLKNTDVVFEINDLSSSKDDEIMQYKLLLNNYRHENTDGFIRVPVNKYRRDGDRYQIELRQDIVAQSILHGTKPVQFNVTRNDKKKKQTTKKTNKKQLIRTLKKFIRGIKKMDVPDLRYHIVLSDLLSAEVNELPHSKHVNRDDRSEYEKKINELDKLINELSDGSDLKGILIKVYAPTAKNAKDDIERLEEYNTLMQNKDDKKSKFITGTIKSIEDDDDDIDGFVELYMLYMALRDGLVSKKSLKSIQLYITTGRYSNLNSTDRLRRRCHRYLERIEYSLKEGEYGSYSRLVKVLLVEVNARMERVTIDNDYLTILKSVSKPPDDFNYNKIWEFLDSKFNIRNIQQKLDDIRGMLDDPFIVDVGKIIREHLDNVPDKIDDEYVLKTYMISYCGKLDEPRYITIASFNEWIANGYVRGHELQKAAEDM